MKAFLSAVILIFSVTFPCYLAFVPGFSGGLLFFFSWQNLFWPALAILVVVLNHRWNFRKAK